MSYKAYVSKALGRDEMKEKNRNAPAGLKYCNAICQEFLEKTQFSGQQVICNKCRSMIGLAEKKIGKKEITIEQFIENPRIVYGLTDGVDAKKTCETCKNEKSIMAFEHGRRHCNECRRLKILNQHQAQLPGILSDIEKLKTNMVDLERYLQFQSKDLLILIMAHYQTGRISADVKSTMIVKILNHFKNLLTPNMCKAGCGASVVIEHSTCLRCTNRPIVHSVEKRQAFMDNLDQMVETMGVIVDIDRYNKDELSMIAKKFGLDFTNLTSKRELFDRINPIIITRKEIRRQKKLAKEAFNKNFVDLVIDQFQNRARSSDGYINVTQMLKMGGKRFDDWIRLEYTREFMNVLESDVKISVSDLIESTKGSSPRCEEELWIHPDLAVYLAQWISPTFGIRVSRWAREVMLTGEYHS
jgi:hypothetical protein